MECWEMQQEATAEEFAIPEKETEKAAKTKENKSKAEKAKKQPER